MRDHAGHPRRLGRGGGLSRSQRASLLVQRLLPGFIPIAHSHTGGPFGPRCQKRAVRLRQRTHGPKYRPTETVTSKISTMGSHSERLTSMARVVSADMPNRSSRCSSMPTIHFPRASADRYQPTATRRPPASPIPQAALSLWPVRAIRRTAARRIATASMNAASSVTGSVGSWLHAQSGTRGENYSAGSNVPSNPGQPRCAYRRDGRWQFQPTSCQRSCPGMNHNRRCVEAENDAGRDAVRTKSSRLPATLPSIRSSRQPRHTRTSGWDGVTSH